LGNTSEASRSGNAKEHTVKAMIDEFPTIDDLATDWDAEQRYWDLMAAAEDYAIYLEMRMAEETEDCEDQDDDDPEPPTPAAPALAIVAPVVRCAVCRDTGRVTKPSIWFAGQSMEGFCPNCTPHYDFATRRFVRPAA